MVRLNALVEKYGNRGLRVVGVSPMERADLQSTYVDEQHAKWWIGCDGRGETLMAFVRFNEPAEFPRSYLVNASGVIVANGEVTDADIEQALLDVFEPDLGRELDGALAAAVASYRAAEYGKAWTSAGEHAASEDARVAADARHLRTKCEAYAAWTRRRIEQQVQAREYPAACALIDETSSRCAGMDVAAWAADTKKALERDPKVRNELTAWKRLEKVQANEKKAGSVPAKRKAVAAEYRALAKAFRGTRAAAEAEAAATRLGG